MQSLLMLKKYIQINFEYSSLAELLNLIIYLASIKMGCQKLIYKPELSKYSSKKLKRRNEMYIYKYRFGFNGQEMDDEVAGDRNTYTAEFWEYDARIGRRFNLDPKGNVWESLYSCFGDNPIAFSDINGDTWDPDNDSRQHVDNLRFKANTTITELSEENNSIDKDVSKIESKQIKKYSEKRAKELENLKNQKENNTARINNLKKLLVNIQEMQDNKDIIFSIEVSGRQNSGATFWKTGTKNTISITFDGGLDLLAHELIHGHQYLENKIDFKFGGGQPGLLHDMTDEVEAYIFQFSLSGQFNLKDVSPEFIRGQFPELYKSLPDKESNTSTIFNQIESNDAKAIRKDNPTLNFEVQYNKFVDKNLSSIYRYYKKK